MPLQTTHIAVTLHFSGTDASGVSTEQKYAFPMELLYFDGPY